MYYGFDIGGSKIALGVFNQERRLQWEKRVATPKSSYEDFLQAVEALVREADARFDRQGTVGIGIPGMPETADGTLYAANVPAASGRPLRADLSARLGRDVRLDNDANCFALSEAWDDEFTQYPLVMGLILGTGVGGGVIVNGKVIDGTHGAGGEIGHITVNRHETATCGCGKHGCLEQYSSATGVVRCMKKLLDENPDADCVLRGRDFEAKDVFDAARNGDALAAREVDEMTDTLGMALATIAATTDPEMFLVGGGVSRAGDVLFDPLVEHYKTYAFKSCRETPIKAASLGNDAGIYGAVRLIVGE